MGDLVAGQRKAAHAPVLQFVGHAIDDGAGALGGEAIFQASFCVEGLLHDAPASRRGTQRSLKSIR